MKIIHLICLLALLGSALPANADHLSECLPPSTPGPVDSLTRACYGHYEKAPECRTWYSGDGYDENRASLYAIYVRAITTSGDHTACTGTESCTVWQTQATAYTGAFYAGGPVVGAVRLQPAQYQATLATDSYDDPCGSEPPCTLVVAADNDDAQLHEEAPTQLPACETLRGLDKPTPGGPGATVPEDLCVGDGAAMACYEHEVIYDPYYTCEGSSDEAWLAMDDGTPLRALVTYSCYEYGDFWTGPCVVASRTIEVSASGATVGIQRTFSDDCRDPAFNPGSGSCSTRIWFDDATTGYSQERSLPTMPSAFCADAAS